MILLRFAIGTFSLALLGMAISLAPTSSQSSHTPTASALVIHR